MRGRTIRAVELLAEGRTAEVFAWGDGRVLKLDRPEWNGLSTFEASVLAIVADAGLPVARPHETVTVEGRTGVVLDRVDGPILADVIAGADDPAPLAAEFVELQRSVNERQLDGLPDLVVGLADGVGRAGWATRSSPSSLLSSERSTTVGGMLCHFDLHPGNVIVAASRWVVIDWITASSGPPDADFARTLVLDPPNPRTARGRFMEIVEREGVKARAVDRARLDGWIRVIAAARLAEGFEGEHAAYLTALAIGNEALMPVAGTLIAESLRVGSSVEGLALTVRKISRADVGDVDAGQPLTWTFVEFEADDSDAERLADALSGVLETAGGWYCDFRNDQETFVVFSGRVFRYPRGDRARRSEAEEHGRSVGVPEAQLDWPE